MRSVPYLLSLLGAAKAALATGTQVETTDSSPNVISLTEKTFYDFIEAHKLVMVNFHSPRCMHCKKFAPQYEEAARVLKNDNIPLATVNCGDEGEFCGTKLDITAWPTVKIFHGPDSYEQYHGQRDPEEIISFMKNELASTQHEKWSFMDELPSTGHGKGLNVQY